jgi:hypothetical protein
LPADPALQIAEEFAALPREEVAARLADACQLVSELSARVERARSPQPMATREPSSSSPRSWSIALPR